MIDRPIKTIRSETTKNGFGMLNYGEVKLIRGRMYPYEDIYKKIFLKILLKFKNFYRQKIFYNLKVNQWRLLMI